MLRNFAVERLWRFWLTSNNAILQRFFDLADMTPQGIEITVESVDQAFTGGTRFSDNWIVGHLKLHQFVGRA